jgi:NADP-dependent 3-hydroxy acid dehydrogenase YdfG
VGDKRQPQSATKWAATAIGEDIAKAVIYALEQAPNVDVDGILIRPTSQPI